jgi:hypothetical protein
VSITGVAGGAIALLAYILRMIARLPCMGGKLGLDDWTMTGTIVCRLNSTVSRHQQLTLSRFYHVC